MTLPMVLAALVGLSLAVYAVTGGFDLGVGLLSLLAPRGSDRDAMLRSLAPVWYGNAIWLAVAAFVLIAAFPSGESLLRASWPYLAVLLLALAVRGAGFALRDRIGALGRGGKVAFGLASGLCVLCQGMVLGAVLSGVPASGRSSLLGIVLGLLCAAGLAGCFALLGAGWLIWRTRGPTRVFGRDVGRAAIILTVGALVLGVAWAMLTGSAVAIRWSAWPGALLPLATVAAAAGLGIWTWRDFWFGRAWATFVRAVLLVVVVFAGLTASLWPAPLLEASGALTARSPLGLEYTLFDVVLAGPVLLAYLVHVGLMFRRGAPGPVVPVDAGSAHTGRRTASADNALHLS